MHSRMGVVGPNQIAAHHVAMNMAALTFIVALGIAAAAGLLFGHAVGRADQAGRRSCSRRR